MVDLARLSHLRPAKPEDDSFLYDVFCTTWEDEVAALPNQRLARHVLRIQHIAQERRFDSRYAGCRRFVVVSDGERIGRFYLFASGSLLHLVDLTLLPSHRSRGIEGRVVGDLMREAALDGLRISLRVGRTDLASADLYAGLGFELVSADDLDNYFEWVPAPVHEMTRDSSHSVP
jgi:GNAT superfamily N-acetyltransferase